MAAALSTPVILLGLLGTLLVSTLIHEFGHAAACHRGGAEPGSIGMGLYVIYPAFFTDVTSSYRLDRAGRLRTDLGGVYFNAITSSASLGAYYADGLPTPAAGHRPRPRRAAPAADADRPARRLLRGRRPGRGARPLRPRPPDPGQPAPRARGRSAGARAAPRAARRRDRLGAARRPVDGRRLRRAAGQARPAWRRRSPPRSGTSGTCSGRASPLSTSPSVVLAGLSHRAAAPAARRPRPARGDARPPAAHPLARPGSRPARHRPAHAGPPTTGGHRCPDRNLLLSCR